MIKVKVFENDTTEIMVGDVFLDSESDQYYIFCRMFDLNYVLMPLTLNMYDGGAQYLDLEQAKLDIHKCIESGKLIKFSSNIYELELNLKLKGSN